MSACCRASLCEDSHLSYLEVLSHLSVASLCCECEGRPVTASDVMKLKSFSVEHGHKLTQDRLQGNIVVDWPLKGQFSPKSNIDISVERICFIPINFQFGCFEHTRQTQSGFIPHSKKKQTLHHAVIILLHTKKLGIFTNH